ncbi:flagellar assembly protein FliW [Nocardioides sp.]|uniref:flagellar assembly protein FliW n=1 Tax=Nocardioides sp. TaxID=35761 RepID=UPI00286B708D|nr:flagellar assembly protein FliW [Nocardioides sp.]
MPDIPVIELVQPLPGFPDLRQFALVQLDSLGGSDDGSSDGPDDGGVLCALRSLEDPDLRFLVLPPSAFFPDYAPVIDDATVAELEIGSAADVLVLVVLNAGDSLGSTTANLVAPVLVNTVTRKACQVILDDPALSISTPLLG